MDGYVASLAARAFAFAIIFAGGYVTTRNTRSGDIGWLSAILLSVPMLEVAGSAFLYLVLWFGSYLSGLEIGRWQQRRGRRLHSSSPM